MSLQHKQNPSNLRGPLPSLKSQAKPREHGVHFASPLHPQVPRVLSGSDRGVPGTIELPKQTSPKELLSRLYDKPENSQALQAVKHREMLNLQEKQGIQVPRPPSGKAAAPTAAFRTTMFKKDFARKTAIKKATELTNEGPLRVEK